MENQFPYLNDQKRNDFLLHLDKYMSSTEVGSIDGFLQEVETYPEFADNRKDFLEIGLLMIIGHVVGWEGSDTIETLAYEHERKRTWLSVLYDFMKATDVIDRGKDKNEINIVTFNYDRILERFLLDAFDEYQVRLFVKAHVFHVYGRIAKLVELDENFEGENDVNLGWPNDDFGYLSQLTKNIKLIRQSVDTNRIKDIVKNCHKLIILGYGLDPINNRRLGLHDWKNEFDQNLIFNIYPGPLPNWDFGPRRKLAEAVRSIRIDANIQYKTCSGFLKYALEREPIVNAQQLLKLTL